MQEADFLKNHGDVLWLKGIQHLPIKMKNLLYFNKALAHQPWVIKTEHVKVSEYRTDVEVMVLISPQCVCVCVREWVQVCILFHLMLE